MGKEASNEGVSSTDRRLLPDAIEVHRTELVRRLDASTLFLTLLAKHKLIDGNDILRFERHRSKGKRNEEVIGCVIRHEQSVSDSYNKFIDALKRSDQTKLVNVLTSVEKELDIVDDYQAKLERHLDDVHSYLKKERRRTEIDFTTNVPSDSSKSKAKTGADANDRVEMSEFLQKVQHTTKSTLVHFDRCKEVIEKLHSDCNSVATKNADLMSKLRDCDDMVKELLPKNSRKNNIIERDDTHLTRVGSSRVTSSRSKKNEAERLVKRIRENLLLADDERCQQKESNRINAKIIDNMADDVEKRKVLLEKKTELPPRVKGGVSKYVTNVEGTGDKSARAKSVTSDPLRLKIEQLADVVEVYVHQEKQISHKINLNKYQTTPVSHRNFDEIDEDLVLLQHELKKEDQGRAMDLARHIVGATKGEREECLKMVNELEKVVRARRLKLQENSARAKGPSAKRRVPQRRVRVSRRTDSSFSKRLNDLNNEIRLYMSLEMDQNQRNQAELLRRKQEYESQCKDQAQEIKRMEKTLKDMEGERGKFKRLYNQEKSVQKSNILKKPTLVGRRTKSRVRSRARSVVSPISRDSPSPRPSRRSRYTPLPKDDDSDYDDRDEKSSSRYLPRRRSSRRLGPVRATTRDNFSDREETPPDTRVRKRSRVRHVSTSKDADRRTSPFPDIK